jgi:Asp-tRNA(Asn)/Glu-tRNA(Gln) amidotransferase A subunit family amidase
MTTRDLAALSATEAAELIGSGTISSVEIVTDCLTRIREQESAVNAFAHLDPDHALAQAQAADQARRDGKGVGPLNGVPIGIKDIIDTVDMPTEHGFAPFAGRRPEKDAALVAQLRSAGAVIMGKTVSSPLANPGNIKTRNPLDTSRNPGTSSSGSAAAVAAGMVPIAVGSQTAGSVIRPASFCGVCGFKPTYGLISRSGVLLQSETLDTMGILARTVDDLALATDAMGAYDPTDPASFRRSRPSLLAVARRPVPVPPLFAFVKSPFWDSAGSTVHEAFGELTETLGQQSENVDLVSLDDLFRTMMDLLAAENAFHYGGLYDRHGDQMSPLLRTSIEKGRKVTAETYLKAKATRERAYIMLQEILINYGCILTLAADGVAPKIDAPFTPNINGIWTFLGVPAVTLPLLEIDGLPLGVQLIGARNDDGRLLRTARWLVNHLAQAA